MPLIAVPAAASHSHRQFYSSPEEVTSMKVLPSLSSIKRIFFSPIDQDRIDRVREQHQRNIHRLNQMTLR